MIVYSSLQMLYHSHRITMIYIIVTVSGYFNNKCIASRILVHWVRYQGRDYYTMQCTPNSRII